MKALFYIFKHLIFVDHNYAIGARVEYKGKLYIVDQVGKLWIGITNPKDWEDARIVNCWDVKKENNQWKR